MRACHCTAPLAVGLVLLASALQAGPVTINGTVLDAEGNPATEAIVFVGYLNPRSLTSVAVATPDAEGRFELSFDGEPRHFAKGDRYAVGAYSPGYALVWEGAVPGTPCPLRLGERPVRCEGAVVDAAGDPLPHARVRWERLDDPQGEKPYLSLAGTLPLAGAADSGEQPAQPSRESALSLLEALRRPALDANGRFRLDAVPPNTLATLYAYAGGKASIYYTTEGPGPHDMRIVLETLGLIRGRVVHEGRPRPGVRIKVDPGRDAAPTMPDGTFWISGQIVRTKQDGRYEKHVRPGVYEVAVWRPKALIAVPIEGVEVGPGEEVTLPDIEIAGELHSFLVTVLRPDGGPAASAHIVGHFPPYPDRPKGKYTDDEGNALFEVAYGAGEVYEGPPLQIIFAHDERLGLAGTAVVQGHDTAAKVQLKPGAYVTGRVMDTQDQPVAGVEVRVSIMAHPQVLTDSLSGKSDAEGKFRVGPLPADANLLRVELAGTAAERAVDRDWPDPKDLTLKPGETRDLPPARLDLAGVTAEGRVLSPDGEPAIGAVVVSPIRLGLRTTVDDAGGYRLEGLLRDKDTKLLAFLREPRLYCAIEVGPTLGYEHDITLAPPGKATGALFTTDGEALVGVRIAPDPGGDFRWSRSHPPSVLTGPDGIPREILRGEMLKTDADGEFAAQNLVDGLEYRFMWEEPENRRWHWADEPFTAVGGETVEVGDIFLEE